MVTNGTPFQCPGGESTSNLSYRHFMGNVLNGSIYPGYDYLGYIASSMHTTYISIHILPASLDSFSVDTKG